MNAKACSWRGEKEREINIFLYKKDFLIFFLSLSFSFFPPDRPKYHPLASTSQYFIYIYYLVVRVGVEG